ncbi:MAG TPA: hypothetical protein ENJ29_05550 [Bacteroidetes bacterium]|nr:hypothetical protein [Bacteroidota bacterium]
MQIKNSGINQSAGGHEVYKARSQEKPAQQDKKTESAGSNKDSLEISSAARQLYAQKVGATDKTQETGESRAAERLENALLEGKVAESREQAGRIREKVGVKMADQEAKSAEKVALAKQRIKEDFYNSPQVAEKIATGLMRDMNLTGQ